MNYWEGYVANIADEKTVKRAERKEKDLRLQQLNDIRTVLNNASGRRFVWRLLEKCKVFGSVYSKDQSMVYFNAGQQDLGHFLMAEITEADQHLLIKMMKDNNKEKSNV